MSAAPTITAASVAGPPTPPADALAAVFAIPTCRICGGFSADEERLAGDVHPSCERAEAAARPMRLFIAGRQLALALADLMTSVNFGTPHDEMGPDMDAGRAALEAWKQVA